MIVNKLSVFSITLVSAIVLAGCSGGDEKPSDADPETGGTGGVVAAPDSSLPAPSISSSGTGVGVAMAPIVTTPEGENSLVELQTSAGPITIELYADKAEKTVQNFLRLTKRGFYNGTIFDEVHPDCAVMGGAYTPDLAEKFLGSNIENEADNGLKNTRGAVSMFRLQDAKDSAATRFFINLCDNPNFDFKGDTDAEAGFCVFGRVTAGIEIADKISKSKTVEKDGFMNLPEPIVTIQSIVQTK